MRSAARREAWCAWRGGEAMFVATEKLTVHRPAGIFDGKPLYKAVPGRGRLIERMVTVPGPEGGTRLEYTILVAPPLIPAKGCRIELGGQIYAIGAVKICRDLAGALVGCRCEVVQ